MDRVESASQSYLRKAGLLTEPEPKSKPKSKAKSKKSEPDPDAVLEE